MEKGWSADNIGFGSGGGLLQKLNRDTQKCAFKASYISDNYGGQIVYKKPIDAPFKLSKKGRMTLTKNGNEWTTNTEQSEDQMKDANNILECVFENGFITKEYNFQQIVSRSSISNENIGDWDNVYQNYDTTVHRIVPGRIENKAAAIKDKNKINTDTNAMVVRLKDDVKKYENDTVLLDEINKARAARGVAAWTQADYKRELDEAGRKIGNNIVKGIF